MLRRAQEARQGGDIAGAYAAGEAALALWRAEPLSDVAGLVGHPAVVALAAEHVRVVLGQAEAAFALGRCEEVLPALSALAARSPLDEFC